MTNLKRPAADLQDAWQLLSQRWEQTKPLWNDSVRWSFEKDHHAPLEDQVRTTQRELERLAQIVAQSQRQVK